MVIQTQKTVRANTRWIVALIFAVGAQLLLVMATVSSWMPAVYTTEVADIFYRGRAAFPRKYDLFLYRALILLVVGLTFVTVHVLKKWIPEEKLSRPLRRFVSMTLVWAALGYWAAFELTVHPATWPSRAVLSIAIAGNWLTWGWWVVNPGWWLPLDSFISTVSAGFKKNAWVGTIIDLGTQTALIERTAFGTCVAFLIGTHQGWLGQISLPYWWPLRFACVGLYTFSFVVPIFYLAVTLIALEDRQGQTSGYTRWCRSMGVAGLVSFFIYVRNPVPANFWLSLWPLMVLAVLAFWKTASRGNMEWLIGIWKSTTVRVWVATLGGMELGLICVWGQEQVRFPIYPSDFSTIVYVAFAAGSFAMYGLLSLAGMGRPSSDRANWPWQENLGTFALLQLVLVILMSMAWFKLVVYDYRGDLARFWFHWLGIIVLLQPLVWFVLRSLIFWGRSEWHHINPKYRAWIVWTAILGLVFGASFVPNIEAMTAHIFMGEYMHHTDCFIMGPAWALAKGAMVNVDVNSMYGIGAVHFFVWLMGLLGGVSFEHLYTVIVWICALYFVLVYVFYRLWLGSTVLALAAWMMAFKAQIAFELAYPFVFTYPNATVARQWPDIIWMVLMMGFMRSGRAWVLGLASLAAGSALWYMPSIGCYMIVAHAVMTAMVAWRYPNWQRRIMGCLWPTVLSVVSAVLMYVAICGHWFFNPVFWNNVIGYLKYYLLTNTSPLIGLLINKEFLDVIVFCIIVFVYIFTIIKVGIDYLNPLTKSQSAQKDWFALGLSIYGLGLLEHFVTFSMGNNYYTKAVPFYFVLFHWISRALACIPDNLVFWRKRLSWALAGTAFVALVTNHAYMSYPNVLNISREPLLDKRVARPLPDGRPYFYHKHRFTISPAMMLPFNNLGNTEDGLVTENDFKDYREMIARYHQDSDFTPDVRLISSLTGSKDKVVLISSYEVRILMQANRRPFFFYFPLLETRPMRVRSLPNDMIFTKSALKRIMNDFEKERPEFVFMEKVMGRDDIPSGYNESEPGLMALLRYVKANYVPYREGHYLMAFKRKN